MTLLPSFIIGNKAVDCTKYLLGLLTVLQDISEREAALWFQRSQIGQHVQQGVQASAFGLQLVQRRSVAADRMNDITGVAEGQSRGTPDAAGRAGDEGCFHVNLPDRIVFGLRPFCRMILSEGLQIFAALTFGSGSGSNRRASPPVRPLRAAPRAA